MSEATGEPQWPPRSPYEAVLSSPKSRRKLQQRQSRLSPSPSPLKKSNTTTSMQLQPSIQAEEDDDEDEETLQLRLQALEAKLKLKRLQNKKARGANTSSDAENEGFDKAASNVRAETSLPSRRVQEPTGLLRSKSAGNVQVPLSPERKPIPVQEQKSPGRVLLGIDKGLSARHVSLRRAPSSLSSKPSKEDPFGGPVRPAASRAESRSAGTLSARYNRTGLKSFNERIAESRKHEQDERERQAKAGKLRAQKSKGFGIQESEIEAFKAASEKECTSRTQEALEEHQRGFSRADVVKAFNKPASGLLGRTGSVTRRDDQTDRGPSIVSQRQEPSNSISRNPSLKAKPTRPGSVSLSDESRPSTPADPAMFEAFSHTNLSRRILPHTFLSRALEHKTPIRIPTLLKDIVAPSFSLPPQLEEQDFVVLGIIASKSSPLTHKGTHKPQATKPSNLTSTEEAAASEANVKDKYMVFTLTDLKWTLDFYIFSTAYVRFRKLQPGTVIAILNPAIMPPRPGKTDTNRWSLTLNSSDDTILEIGTAKDLGWCKAMKKDGNPCNAWVDNRKNDYCEFHVDRNVEQARRGRMEVQGMSAPFAPGGKGAGRHGFFGSTRRSKKDESNERGGGLLKEGPQYDRSVHSTYFINSHMGNRSAANLLDADEDSAMHGSREERVRRTFAEQEKEREIARRLGDGGNGTGAEYLRLHQGSTFQTVRQSTTDTTISEASDARSLGLKNNKAGSVMLSPLKRKASLARRAREKDGNEVDDPGPKRKKTRFVTAKGIREAGRESLIGTGSGIGHGDVDLDIV